LVGLVRIGAEGDRRPVSGFYMPSVYPDWVLEICTHKHFPEEIACYVFLCCTIIPRNTFFLSQNAHEMRNIFDSVLSGHGGILCSPQIT